MAPPPMAESLIRFKKSWCKSSLVLTKSSLKADKFESIAEFLLLVDLLPLYLAASLSLQEKPTRRGSAVGG
jgi:hypothetical protein